MAKPCCCTPVSKPIDFSRTSGMILTQIHEKYAVKNPMLHPLLACLIKISGITLIYKGRTWPFLGVFLFTQVRTIKLKNPLLFLTY